MTFDPNPKAAPRDSTSRILKILQGTGRFIQYLFTLQLGQRPSKNTWKRFMAAFFGAYLAISSLGVAWIQFMSLWSALQAFAAALSERNLYAIASAIIITLPMPFSFLVGWIVSGSSEDETTWLTLFFRSFVLIIVLCVLLVAAIMFLYAVFRAPSFASSVVGSLSSLISRP
jgi:hypothetical protein